MKEFIDAWQGKHVLVAGDPGYDVYHFGHVDRVSPEAPVPVFIEDTIEDRPGMAYNVCQNLAALGCVPLQLFPPEPWSVKRRFMVGTHQLLRVDKDRWDSPISDRPEVDLTSVDAVILSDYAKGWLTDEFCARIVLACRERSIPCVVDPKLPDWSKFIGCTVICPNSKEYSATHHGRVDDGLGKDLSYAFDAVLIKQGAKGLTLRTNPSGWQDFPATARHVYDVTGAGDTVVATLAAALAAGAHLAQAAQLANVAAGWVVGEVGTAACTAETLKSLCG